MPGSDPSPFFDSLNSLYLEMRDVIGRLSSDSRWLEFSPSKFSKLSVFNHRLSVLQEASVLGAALDEEMFDSPAQRELSRQAVRKAYLAEVDAVVDELGSRCSALKPSEAEDGYVRIAERDLNELTDLLRNYAQTERTEREAWIEAAKRMRETVSRRAIEYAQKIYVTATDLPQSCVGRNHSCQSV